MTIGALPALWALLSLNVTVPASKPIEIDTTAASEAFSREWLRNLYEPGVIVRGDSIIVNAEARQLLVDPELRKLVYPESYSWLTARELIRAMELKKAFWYLTNLYETDSTNRNVAVSTLLAYDGVLEMDKALVSAFYTYGFLGPKVCRVVGGKPEVIRPDLVEAQLGTVRDLVGKVKAVRAEKARSSENSATGAPAGGKR